MPKRTNDFQRLIAVVQSALAPLGAAVRESAELPTKSGGYAREIDVLVTDTSGPRAIKVAFEAKDEGEPMHIIEFESYIGKYLSKGGVTVDKVVMVAKRGYSQQVVDRAKDEGIELLSFTEAIAADWASLTGGARLSLRVKPHLIGIGVSPAVPKRYSRSVFDAGQVLHLSGPKGTVREFATGISERSIGCHGHMFQELERQATLLGTAFLESKTDLRSLGFSIGIGKMNLPLEYIVLKWRAINRSGPAIVRDIMLTDSAGAKSIARVLEGDLDGTKLHLGVSQQHGPQSAFTFLDDFLNLPPSPRTKRRRKK